jgi:2-polyprenyl-6-methoxyphenol hydroxylase-like FAD-dependent oxidoreductase
VIVGARCAGAATALALARAGLDVLVIERAGYAADALSTHALMRPGVVQLERLGVLDALRASGAAKIESTTFYYGEQQLALAVKPGHGADALYAPRRSVLDALLVDAARRAGAEVRHHVALTELLFDVGWRVRGVVVQGPNGREEITAELVIGADGRKSSVARMVGAEVTRRGTHASSFVYGYYEGLDLLGYHWLYRPGSAAGSVATHADQCCVFAALPNESGQVPRRMMEDFEGVLRCVAPWLADRIARARRCGPLRAFAGRPGHLRRASGPGWALVGDAGFYKEPLTSHGMTAALRDAELLARAVLSGRETALLDYEAERDALSIDQLEIGDAFASFEWDLEQAQALHLRLAETVRRELAVLIGPGALAARAA